MMYPAIPVSEKVALVVDECGTAIIDDDITAGCPMLLVVSVTTVLIVLLTYVKGSAPVGAVAMSVRRIVIDAWVTMRDDSVS
jgi:hypothetical protein